MWSRCIEQKVGRQNELISGSLTDLGCEQPACDISGSSNNLESLSPISTEDTQSQSSIGKKKSAHVINILRKPFARKTESPSRYRISFFNQTNYGCPAPLIRNRYKAISTKLRKKKTVSYFFWLFRYFQIWGYLPLYIYHRI